MDKELIKTYSDLDTQKIKISSIDKLDNNYIRIIGNENTVSVITNGLFTLNINSSSTVKKIVRYIDADYLIVRNIYGEYSLISLNTGEFLIRRVKEINYIDDGLFGVSEKESGYAERVFDLNTNSYIPFPDNMIFREYKDNVLVLQERDIKKHIEMVIDREGVAVLPKINGSIRIINNSKFIYDNKIIDFSLKTIIEESDMIMPLSSDKVMVLKNRKLFILNGELEIIKTYMIGETKRPWYVSVNNEDCIVMGFKKKVKIKKYEPRRKEDVTVIINVKTDSISKTDIIPRLGSDEFFIIKGKNNKVGLMNKKYEEILKPENDVILALQDKDNKYFFIENDNKYYIFDAKTKTMLNVSYTSMKPFKDGLAIGYTPEPKNYQLIDEELNPVFNLKHMGHSMFYYKNDILCYHSGNYLQGYDAYTIITKKGEVLMPSRKCRIKKNNFDLLEINDYETGKNILFNMNRGQFEQLELNVPFIETANGKKLDFSKIPIEQLISNDEIPLLEENTGIAKSLLKPEPKE